MAARRDSWVRWFDVTNPIKHSDGYTIYKVASKVFPVHSPEATTEIIVWKRYKDFLKLHKTLYLVHRNLHRPQAFPGFPKPQIFGRFDEAIIEERRQAALELLNFIASQAHLFNSLAVQQFFETTIPYEETNSTDEPNILQPESFTPLIQSETPDSEGGSATNSDEINSESTSIEDRIPENSPQAGGHLENSPLQNKPPGGGLPSDQLFEGTPLVVSSPIDRFSVDSSLEDRALEDRPLEHRSPVERSSVEGLPLDDSIVHRPFEERSSVDRFSSGGEPLTGDDFEEVIKSLAENNCVTSDLDDGSIRFGNNNSISARSSIEVGNVSELQDQSVLRGSIMSEFDPCHGTGFSSQDSNITNSQLLADCGTVSQSEGSADETSLQRLFPADTLATYVQGKQDYLYKAVKQIRKARKEEGQGHYQVAFDYYKRAVAMLLTGVQGDSDEARRCVVRRKTAEYLLYAEELHTRHLDSTGEDSNRWSEQKVPRHVAKLRAGLAELANFKVLGLIGGNMLVLDKLTEETSVVKVLQKNAQVMDRAWSTQVVPTKCARTVKLKRYFETESTIYLLLEYAQGGTLWQYVHNYLQAPEPQSDRLLPDGADNIYSGKKYSTSGDKETELKTGVDHVAAALAQDECSENYRKVVLGIDSPSLSGSNTGSINEMESPDMQAAMPQISPQAPASDDVFCAEANRGLASSGDSCEHPATRRMSLRRSNSSKSRSASVERASDSVNSARHRNWSTFIEELEVSERRHSRPYLPESCVQRWAAELLLAIDELHHTGLILGDLKPDNLLLDSRGHIVLTYFCQWPGVARDILGKSAHHLYVSPEARLPGGMCKASDYWSFGVLLYELLAGVSLGSVHPRGITSHTILHTPQHLSTEADHLLKQLLRCNPRERLGDAAGVEEIKAHPFFQKIVWSAI
ncbi:ribosomal protein S6 kinase-like 1 isoform X2 [Watersipora subatra]|uniref:ribosomal protein S6 kinase-like 1 isoform X2 n=1 Tax=Watersipora subatra TaxID=2589382 RepID=UPI00355B0A91